MPAYNLDAVETRILGCLLEKERVTPEKYPRSLNSLTAACNQSTNREPIVSFDERTVEDALFSLREKKLATVIFGAGSRVQKYRHNLLDHYNFSASDVALLCVLLLRGAQTPGELRARAERLHPFRTVEEVDHALEDLARGELPLVRMLPARAGQKERRFIQLFSAEGVVAEATAEDYATPAMREPAASAGLRIDALGKEMADLKVELQQLREEFAEFRKQFE